MLELGRVCLKVSGREAGMKCVVIEKSKDNFVIVDGETRRKRCNVNHLEPLDLVLKIKKDASREDVLDAMKKAGLKVEKVKEKKKQPKEEKAVSKKAKK